MPQDVHGDENESTEAITAETAMELGYIRDAIHRDGPEADAIRDALRLEWESALDKPGRRGINPVRRVVGEWQEVQP